VRTYSAQSRNHRALTTQHLPPLHTPAVILSLAWPKYFLGFYFWLDILSTLSLLFDLPQVLLLLTPVGAGQTTGTGGTLAAAGRTAYAAAKVGQILRLVRLARMLASGLRDARAGKAPLRSGSRFSGSGVGSDKGANSRLGSKLGDLTTRRVIIGVWCILLASPLFEEKFYPQGNPTSFEFGGLQVVHDTCASCALALATGNVSVSGAGNATTSVSLPPLSATPGSASNPTCVTSCYAAVDEFVSHSQGLLTLTVIGTDVAPRYSLSGVPSTMRSFEQLPVDLDASSASGGGGVTFTTGTTRAVFNRASLYRLKAILGLSRIAFLCGMLAAGVYFFTLDADRLVLQPIERMMRRVQDMGDNPLLAASAALDDANAKLRRSGSTARGGLAARLRAKALAKAENYETQQLESSMSKICSLMALGFGDAGAQIIAENMRVGGALNPMVPGKKMCAVFGFCDIRAFTDATEVLQEEVMEFVNTIARLVHSHVTSRGGSANKNIGDAFLLVWKFPPGAVTPEDVAAVSAGTPPPSGPAAAAAISAVADNALAAFMAVIASLRSSPQLARFNTHPGLLARLGTDFSVRMGFGLHVGWAIEGAIGSEHKVDASYLSPHVNIAARLEAATKQFGVPLLLSSHFARLLSADVRAACRVVDCVTLKGCQDPLDLYTFDADADFQPQAQSSIAMGRSGLPHGGSSTGGGGGSSSGFGIAAANHESGLTASSSATGSAFGAATSSSTSAASPGTAELLGAPYIATMRTTLPAGFLSHWRAGYEAYTLGRWSEARDVLTQHTLHARVASPRAGGEGAATVDGPSQVLLGVMEKHGWRAPNGWKGFRELTEK
jgi:class 3 adenylate cyclase